MEGWREREREGENGRGNERERRGSRGRGIEGGRKGKREEGVRRCSGDDGGSKE